MLLRTNLSFQVEKNANPKNLHDMNYSPLNGPNVTFSKCECHHGSWVVS